MSQPPDDPDETDESLSLDEGLEVLNNPRRRYVLYVLERHPDGMSIGDLADEVAAWEQGTSVEELTKQQRKRVYVSLYQTHVVKMADLGVVDFDRDEGLVQLTDKASQITSFLPPARETRPWPRYYLLFAAFGVVVSLAALYEVSVFAAFPVIGVVAAIYVGFCALVALHYYDVKTASTDFADLVNSK